VTLPGDRRPLRSILADWREAERQLATVRDTAARARLEREIERLRIEYQAAHRCAPVGAAAERTARARRAAPIHR